MKQAEGNVPYSWEEEWQRQAVSSGVGSVPCCVGFPVIIQSRSSRTKVALGLVSLALVRTSVSKHLALNTGGLSHQASFCSSL